MKSRETKSLLVTGCFLAVLIAMLFAGFVSVSPPVEEAAAASLDQYVPDAQFVQYLEYRARLENSSNCH